MNLWNILNMIQRIHKPILKKKKIYCNKNNNNYKK
jgi:hypothetical protein